MTGIIYTDNSFTQAQQAMLITLASLMIPAGTGMPSAADDAICRPALADLGRHAPTVAEALGWLEDVSQWWFNDSFTRLSQADQQTAVEQLKQEKQSFVALLQTHIIACYYRDDRVLTALDLPARAPFPEGNAVKPTDWSLLDPVRKRDPFYRDA